MYLPSSTPFRTVRQQIKIRQKYVPAGRFPNFTKFGYYYLIWAHGGCWEGGIFLFRFFCFCFFLDTKSLHSFSLSCLKPKNGIINLAGISLYSCVTSYGEDLKSSYVCCLENYTNHILIGKKNKLNKFISLFV